MQYFQTKTVQYHTWEKAKVIEMLTVDNVLCTYTGKTGCMCGCNGNYYITEASRAEATANRGYEYEDTDVKPRAVTMAVNRLVSYISNMTEEQLQCAVDKEELFIAADKQYIGTQINGRSHFVYFNSKVHKRK